MGAEFVTEGYTVLPALVSRLGLELAPMGMSFTRRDPRGGIGVDAATLDAALAALVGGRGGRCRRGTDGRAAAGARADGRRAHAS